MSKKISRIGVPYHRVVIIEEMRISEDGDVKGERKEKLVIH